MDDQYVIANGSAFDGIGLYGPYDSPEDATEDAERLDFDDWEVVRIKRPEEA